jgi:hypothetical protein
VNEPSKGSGRPAATFLGVGWPNPVRRGGNVLGRSGPLQRGRMGAPHPLLLGRMPAVDAFAFPPRLGRFEIGT